MIQLLYGTNSFEIERVLTGIVGEFNGAVERYDGSAVSVSMLPSILAGATLFAENKLVIIRGLSENKPAWDVLADWVEKVPAETTLIVVEAACDKRTKTYKRLQKHAKVHEYMAWTPRDRATALGWVQSEAAKLGMPMDSGTVTLLVDRVGLDQWQLWHALNKLAMCDVVTEDVIRNVIDPNEQESVFDVFEAALRGDAAKVQHLLRVLEQTEDAYKLFGLLSGQALQLLALTLNSDAASVAKDLGVHPYALGKLAPYARRLGKSGAGEIVREFARADEAMKSSDAEPWLLIQRVLMGVAVVSRA